MDGQRRQHLDLTAAPRIERWQPHGQLSLLWSATLGGVWFVANALVLWITPAMPIEAAHPGADSVALVASRPDAVAIVMAETFFMAMIVTLGMAFTRSRWMAVPAAVAGLIAVTGWVMCAALDHVPLTTPFFAGQLAIYLGVLGLCVAGWRSASSPASPRRFGEAASR